ncbi:MAG: hypothetical protein JSW14_00055 [Candidatus Bathyarchaeum sp.]|nr:MAG: hypothetical protein JSW14_00055 [Candidatus Bathyarchaeum sp.]
MALEKQFKEKRNVEEKEVDDQLASRVGGLLGEILSGKTNAHAQEAVHRIERNI